MSGEIKPFHERLADGQEFEDFCMEVLWDNGIALMLYRSKQRQWSCGESKLGGEIKRDGKWQKTGNLFIECEERRDTNSPWRAAGIYDASKPWLYIIGDEHTIWIHGVTVLQILHKQGCCEWKDTGTAKGFVLPIIDADYYALKIIKLKQKPESQPWKEMGQQIEQTKKDQLNKELLQPTPLGRNTETNLF